MPRVSEEKRQKILEMFSQGHTIEEIASKLNLSVRTVLKVLEEEGAMRHEEIPDIIQLEDETFTQQLQKQSQRTIQQIINRVARNLTESFVRSGVAVGLEITDRYKWVAKSWGYDKIEDFIEDAIKFYMNYVPVVMYIYQKLDLLEKVYIATYVTLERIYRLMAYAYLTTLIQLLDGVMQGKINPEETTELIKEIHKFIHDALDRITGKPISEIVGESEKTGNSYSRSPVKIGGGSGENNPEGCYPKAHDDSGKSTTNNA